MTDQNTTLTQPQEPSVDMPTSVPEVVSAAPLRQLAVGVQHRTAGDIYTFVTNDAELKLGDYVVVEGEHGDSVGRVIVPPHEAVKDEPPKNAKRILRRASEEDFNNYLKSREEACGLFDICERKIAEHNLPMKIIDAELTEGGKKVIFFFFAEQRVDFRALVKELAASLHRFIEMRQIGARDASGFIGCMGPCGRTTCCSSYLRQFQSISIGMAKTQGLSPNPLKLTGMCGKLKCCLAYENKTYQELRQGLPKVNSWVTTPSGVGKIVNIDILQRRCFVRLHEGGEAKFSCDECPHAEKPVDVPREEREDKHSSRRKRTERPMQKRPRTAMPIESTPPEETPPAEAPKEADVATETPPDENKNNGSE